MRDQLVAQVLLVAELQPPGRGAAHHDRSGSPQRNAEDGERHRNYLASGRLTLVEDRE